MTRLRSLLLWLPTVCLAAVCLAALCLPGVALGDTRRFGLIVGNNRGGDAEELRFAEQDARKIYDVLRELGGFAEPDLVLLLGATASDARTALDRLEHEIRRHREQGGERTLLLVYYSGHAEGDELTLGESRLEFAELAAMVKGSSADVRLAFIDACLSGRLLAAKGGRRGPGFTIDVHDELASVGYAVITSSGEDELSHESAEIRGSFFTHYLVSALRGAGDESGDGRITLAEAYQHAYRHTVARTSATVGRTQHPMYDFELSGRGDVVLTDTTRVRTRLIFASPERGRLALLTDDRARLVAEADVVASGVTTVFSPPGRYELFFITSDTVRRAEVQLAPDEETFVPLGALVEEELDTTLPKGGLFQDDRQYVRLSGAALLRRFPLAGASLAYGGAVDVSLERPVLTPVAHVTYSTAPDAGLSRGFFDLGLLAGVGHSFDLGSLALSAEALAGYEHMFQSPRDGARRDTSGFAYLARAGLFVPLGALVATASVGGGGRLFRLREQGLVHRWDWQASCGLAVDIEL